MTKISIFGEMSSEEQNPMLEDLDQNKTLWLHQPEMAVPCAHGACCLKQQVHPQIGCCIYRLPLLLGAGFAFFALLSGLRLGDGESVTTPGPRRF